jgi:hypothetical protein
VHRSCRHRISGLQEQEGLATASVPGAGPGTYQWLVAAAAPNGILSESAGFYDTEGESLGGNFPALSITVVPEPTSIALTSFAGVVLCLSALHRRLGTRPPQLKPTT